MTSTLSLAQEKVFELSSVGHYTLNKANCRGEWIDAVVTWEQSCRVKHDVQDIYRKNKLFTTLRKVLRNS